MRSPKTSIAGRAAARALLPAYKTTGSSRPAKTTLGELTIRSVVRCGSLLLLAAGSFAVLAQSAGGQFEVHNSTIDNGGGRSSGGPFSVIGTIGQPDASPSASGAEFELTGGFWNKSVVTPPSELMFADGFEGS